MDITAPLTLEAMTAVAEAAVASDWSHILFLEMV
jgi:hypothetical protein